MNDLHGSLQVAGPILQQPVIPLSDFRVVRVFLGLRLLGPDFTAIGENIVSRDRRTPPADLSVLERVIPCAAVALGPHAR